MDLIWLVVAIAGCVALATCIALVLLRPMDSERRRLRPIANAARLTRLPEYVRARRARTRSAVIAMVLLVVTFACAVAVAARPTGLPTSARQSDGADPEDVMVCVGAPVADPAVGATLRYFADQMDGFGSARIGLTSPNRRVVPLTRDYQYAKGVFSDYAQAAGPRGDVEAFAPAVSYVDYAESIEDVLGLCITGFPGFDQQSAQRRSLIYVGPGELDSPRDGRPSLFTAAQIDDMARTADVQVNALVTGPASPFIARLVQNSGGRSFSAGADAAARVADIRANPPATRSSESDAVRSASVDSPDVPLVLALVAITLLAWWPVVQRR